MAAWFSFLFLLQKEGGKMLTWPEFMVDNKEGTDVCRLAILLAMSTSQKMEKELISMYGEMGVRGAVTTLSGFGISSQSKIIRNVVNLCLNTHLIERKREHIHPVCHCILETAQSTRASDAIGQNFLFKAAAVRKGNHFALSFYGDLGMHELSSHKSIGVGFQILGD